MTGILGEFYTKIHTQGMYSTYNLTSGLGEPDTFTINRRNVFSNTAVFFIPMRNLGEPSGESSWWSSGEKNGRVVKIKKADSYSCNLFNIIYVQYLSTQSCSCCCNSPLPTLSLSGGHIDVWEGRGQLWTHVHKSIRITHKIVTMKNT